MKLREARLFAKNRRFLKFFLHSRWGPCTQFFSIFSVLSAVEPPSCPSWSFSPAFVSMVPMNGYLISLNITFVEIYPPNQIWIYSWILTLHYELWFQFLNSVVHFWFVFIFQFSNQLMNDHMMHTTNYKASFSKVFNLKMITLKLKEL